MLPKSSFRILRTLSLRAAMVAACTVLSCGAGLAADSVSMTVHSQDNDYKLEGSFLVKADLSVAWDVLTAYEQIPRFVGSLKKSHVTEDLGPYHFLLAQEFEGGFLFFTQKVGVLLDVHENWYQTIDFTDIVHKDFEVYQGDWQVSPDSSDGLRITYNLEAKPKFSAPFTGDFMNGGAKDLLEAVRKEILRRQSLADVEQKKDTPTVFGRDTGNSTSSGRTDSKL